MSDPFGDDDLDFDTEKFLRTAYNSAISMLRDRRRINQTRVPIELINPLVVATPNLWAAGLDEGSNFGSGTGGGFLTGGGSWGGGGRREKEPQNPDNQAHVPSQWEV